MASVNLEKKAIVLERDRCCVICGKSSSLAIHHIKPRRLRRKNEWINHPHNLCVLCDECHVLIEAPAQRLGSWLSAMAVWLIAGPVLQLARFTAPIRFWRVRRQLQTCTSDAQTVSL